MPGPEIRGKYAIVGVGETEYSRNSGRTTRAMGAEAIRNAMQDAGMWEDRKETSWGMLSYQGRGSANAPDLAGEVGIRLDFFFDCMGGGSSTEALTGMAVGVIEAGMCDAVIINRSMNGFTETRTGGTGQQAPRFTTANGLDTLQTAIYGFSTPLQNFSLAFVRHMHNYGTTNEQLAEVKVAHSWGASNNPKAYYKTRLTVEDVVNSRYIVKPFHLLDCCVETDNATAIIVTTAERAASLAKPVVKILGLAGRVSKWQAGYPWQNDPISQVAGEYNARILWPNAGVGPEDIDITGSYDAFTFTSLIQLEAYGFCPIGEGGNYVSDGTIKLGGRRPNNPSGGHLCEGYTHGMNMVIENVRQLRLQVDDYCEGEHTYDYSEGACRQVQDPEITANLGWANPGTASSMVMTNQ
ncbi:MAG: thiolase [Chloroflexi bacterium]|nr:thiolase [Chloroflexota bacterium]